MNFNGYLTMVISASAIGIIADIISSSYGKHGKNIEKYVKLAVSLCVLGCILLPAMKNTDFDTLFENSLFESEAVDTLNENDSLYLMEIDVGEKVSEYIFSKTGIKPTKVCIDMELKEGEECVSIKSATVTVADKDKSLAENVKTSAFEALGTEVDIIYE